MRVLVTGAYGLIGSYVSTRLYQDGHAVTGAGRDIIRAQRRMPAFRWLRVDLAHMDDTTWLPHLVGVDAVVNCAGALQDGPRDDLQALHVAGVLALARACERAGIRRFVQISALGVATGTGRFSETKRTADAALAALDLDWVILRPALVLAPAAFGGSALLRGLAAFPGVIPVMHADAVIHTVAVEDVAEAVSRCVLPSGPARIICDLGAAEPTRLQDVLQALRAWLGLPPAPVLSMPAALGRASALISDGLATLGWRSPMRSATMRQLAAGLPIPPDQPDLGFQPRTLSDTLAQWPSGVQERWFARLYFLKPAALATLAVFWGASGLVGLVSRQAAALVLTRAGIGHALSMGFVLAGVVADLAIAACLCCRRTAPGALLAAVLVTLSYLAGATIWRPDLWDDPLGPLVKAVPAAVLALMALAVMDER